MAFEGRFADSPAQQKLAPFDGYPPQPKMVCAVLLAGLKVVVLVGVLEHDVQERLRFVQGFQSL